MTDYLPTLPDQDSNLDWLQTLAQHDETVELAFTSEVPFDMESDNAQRANLPPISLEAFGFAEEAADVLEQVIEIQEPVETWDWTRDLLPMFADEITLERELEEIWDITDLAPAADPERQAQNGRALMAMQAAGLEIPDDQPFDLRTSAFHSTLEDPESHTTNDVWFIPSVFNASREADPSSGWQSVLLTLEEASVDKPMDPILIVPFGGVGDLDQARSNAQQVGQALTEHGLDTVFDVMQQLDTQQLGRDMDTTMLSHDVDLDIG